MGMTMTQKILAAHAGLSEVKAGQLIEADLDLVLGNDITSPVAIHEMDKMTVKTVFDKDKIALVPDHFVPNKDIKSAEHCKCVRQFAMKHEITLKWDRWVLNMHCFRNRDLRLQATLLSVRIHIPVHTVRSAHFLQV